MKFFSNPFPNLLNLCKIVLIFCDFANMPSKAFKCLPNLEILINNYPENSSHLSYGDLSRLKLLQVQIIDNFFFLTDLNRDLLTLELLESLTDSSFTKIFSELKHDNLLNLNLSSSAFQHFDGKSLSGLTALKSLKLERCGLKTVNLAYDHFTSLESLCLKENHLESLDNTFVKLVNLKTLDLSYNHFKFDPNVFWGLEKLEKIYLAQVYLSESTSTVCKEIFSQLVNLKVLDLKRNQLTQLDPDMFINMTKLTKLDLSNNKLSLEAGVFTHLKSLKSLDLSRNELKKIPSDIFVNQECLEFLGLAENEMCELNESMLNGLVNLRSLDVSSNEIEDVALETFANMKNLKSVNLNINLIVKDKQEELANFYATRVSFSFKVF